jgi:hypothetical protein
MIDSIPAVTSTFISIYGPWNHVARINIANDRPMTSPAADITFLINESKFMFGSPREKMDKCWSTFQKATGMK